MVSFHLIHRQLMSVSVSVRVSVSAGFSGKGVRREGDYLR